MCDVTFPSKSWENCYVTIQDYRRRFADPYNIGVWDADYVLSGLTWNSVVKSYALTTSAILAQTCSTFQRPRLYKAQIKFHYLSLCRSGLEQEDMRVLYKYLTTSLLPVANDEVGD